MAIELAVLEVPIRVTGDTNAAGALKNVERAGQQAAQGITQATNRMQTGLEATGTTAVRAGQQLSTGVGGGLKQVQTATRLTTDELKGATAWFDNLYGASTKAAGGVASVTKAGDGFARIGQDIRQAQVDFRAGILSQKDFKIALATARAEAVALRGTVGPLVGRDLVAFNQVLGATGPAAAVAHRGIGTVRSALATMGAQMLGVRTVFGQVTGSLLNFAAGSVVATAVIAGLTLIAAAWDKVGGAAKRAKKESEDAQKALTPPTPPGQAVAKNLVAIAPAQRQAEDDLKRLTAELNLAELALSGVSKELDPARWAQLTAEVGRLQVKVTAADVAVKKFGEQVAFGRQQLEQTSTTTLRTSAELLAAQIELGQVTDAQVEQATALAAQLRVRAAAIKTVGLAETDRAKAVEEQNALLATAIRLEGTLDAIRKARQAALAEEAQTLRAIAEVRALTPPEVARLRTLEEQVNAALGVRGLLLREEERLRKVNLDLAAAAAAQAARTTVSFPERIGAPGQEGGGFGKPFQPTPVREVPREFAAPRTPAMEFGPFGPDADTTGDFFGGFGTQLDDLNKLIAQKLGETRQTLDQGIGAAEEAAAMRAEELTATLNDILVGGIAGLAAGIGAALAGENIGGVLLGALGQAFQQFGAAIIAGSIIIKKALAALASLNPVAAIGLGAALIALGSFLSSKAQAAFGGGSGGGRGREPDTFEDTESTGTVEPARMATGGPVAGSGTGDTVPAMLTPGEHVITAPEVKAAGGHRAVFAFRETLRKRLPPPVVSLRFAASGMQRFASGGPVMPQPRADMQRASRLVPTTRVSIGSLVALNPRDPEWQRMVATTVDRATRRGL